MAKILIIDDEIKLRETIAELFSFINYQVFEAQDGSEGLEKVQEHKPDLIICDVMMPKLDGYGFLERHQKSNRDQPQFSDVYEMAQAKLPKSFSICFFSSPLGSPPPFGFIIVQ